MTVQSGLRDRYPDVPALLEAIRLRPGMFLGHKTISGLALFLHGIGFAEDFYSIPKESRISGFEWESFEQWVAARYNRERLSLNSLSLAAHLAAAEDAGFDLWFRWYDEFNESRLSASTPL